MNQTYLVEFEVERDRTKRYEILTAHVNATWRELQNKFDPRYLRNNLRFYYLGGEINFKQGE